MDAPDSDRSDLLPIHRIDAPPLSDPAAPLLIDVCDRSGRRLLATAEPVDPTPAGEAVSHHALAALRRGFLFAEHEALADTVRHAFEAATSAVYAENDRPGDRRRILVGVTAVATDGTELLVALAPPGQAIVVQGGHLFAFPDLASWRPNYEPAPDQPGADPLGLSESVQPAMYSTLIAAGDAVLVGSTDVGRCLAATSDFAELAANPAWLPAAVKRATTANRLGCAAWMTVASDVTPDPVAPSPVESAALGEAWLSPSLRRAEFVDRFRTRLIDLFERRFLAAATSTFPLANPRRASSPPGAGYVRRYRGAWRGDGSVFSSSHLPRGSRLPVRGRAIVALLVLLLTLGSLYAGYDYRQTRGGEVESLIAETDAHLAAITASQPPVAVEAQLKEAETSLDAAARGGAAAALLRSRREAITAIRDRMHDVTRLTGVTRLGTLPAAADPASVRLLAAGNQLYLVAGAIYRIDPQSETLTRLLEPGSTVAGRTVGARLVAALDGDTLMVSDGHTLYHLAPGGTWQESKLGSAGDVQVVACAAYLGSFYLLDAAGEILKYPADRPDAPPEAWLRDGETLDAYDLVVDGSIYALGAGGEITPYFRGAAGKGFRPEVDPPIAGPVALVGGPDTKALYLADTNGVEGRILRFDRHGQGVRQLLLPLSWQEGWIEGAADEFAHVSDIAVDEASGAVYFVGRAGIWRASIPK
jgi:hypothetical protein